jgi:hypothetical protein
MIRQGLDQCRLALRKLEKRKLYREYKAMGGREKYSRLVDIRGARYDYIVERVEDVMLRLRDLKDSIEYDLDEDGSQHDSEMDSDDGWADPVEFSQALTGSSQPDPSHKAKTDELPPLMPYPYANDTRRAARRTLRSVYKTQNRHHKSGIRASAANGAHEVTGRSDIGDKVTGDRREEDSRSLHSGKRILMRSEDVSRSVQVHRKSRSTRRLSKGPKRQQQQQQHGDTRDGVSDYANNEDDSIFIAELQNYSDDEGGDQSPRWTTGQLHEDASEDGSVDANFYTAIDRDNLSLTHNNQLVHKDGLRFIDPKSPLRSFKSSAKRKHRTRKKAQDKDEQQQQRVNIHKSGTSVFQFSDWRISSFTDHAQALPECSHLSVSLLCSELRERYPGETCLQSLRTLSSYLADGYDMLKPHVAQLYSTCLSCLRKNDCPVLQQLVAHQSPALKAHVSLLVFLVGISTAGLNACLTSDDKDIYDVFSPNSYRSLHRQLFIQLLDSVLSLALPQAWCMPPANALTCLQLLQPLRDALCSSGCTFEDVCKTLCLDVPVQQWQKNGAVAFVSSVDFGHWQRYLCQTQAEDSPSPLPSRYGMLGDVLPRCEIDAMWSVLTYFSTTTVASPHSGHHSGKLLQDLLVRGSLIDKVTDGTQPIHPSHLETVCRDLDCLSNLLDSPSLRLSTFPETFGMELLKRALLFRADSMRSHLINASNESTRTDLNMSKTGLEALLREVTMVSALHCKNTAAFPSSRPALVTPQESTRCVSILPDCKILRSCLEILLQLLQRVSQKKLLRKRLDTAIKSLVDSLLLLEKDANTPTGVTDTFMRAFGEDHSAGIYSAYAFTVRESVAWIQVMQNVATHSSLTESSHTGRSLSGGQITSVFESVWEAVASDRMKSIHQSIVRQSLGCNIVHPTNTPLYSAEITRLVSYLLQAYFGMDRQALPDIAEMRPLPQVNTMTRSDMASVLSLLFAAYRACLICACSSQHDHKSNLAVCWHIVYSLVHARNTLLFQDNKEELLKVLQESFTQYLLPSLHACLKTVLACTIVDEYTSQYFELLLATIQLGFSFVGVADPPCATNDVQETQQASEDDWGDLSDDMFLSVDTIQEAVQRDCRHSILLLRDLIESIQSSRPSLRFTVPVTHNYNVAMTTQSKLLVSRCLAAVCECIVSILVSDHVSRAYLVDGAVLSGLQSLLSVDLEKSVEDQEYFQAVSSKLISHTAMTFTSLSALHAVMQISSCEVVATCFDLLLCAKHVRKLPAANSELVEAIGTPESRVKERAFYLHCQTRNVRSISKAIEENRSLCCHVGQLLDAENDTQASLWKDVGQLLCEGVSANASQACTTSLGWCSEQYIIDMIRYFREAFRILNDSDDDADETSRSKLVCSIMLSATRNLQMLMSALTSRFVVGKMKGKEARKVAFCTAYAELHVSLILFTLQQSSQCSPLVPLLTFLAESFLPSILQQPVASLSSLLSALQLVATSIYNGKYMPHNTSFQEDTSSRLPYRSEPLDFFILQHYVRSVLRRSREIICVIAKDYDVEPNKRHQCLLHSLILSKHKGYERYIKRVAQSFFPHYHSRQKHATTLVLASLSQEDLYKCYDALWEDDTPSIVVTWHLDELKCYVLHHILCPSLLSEWYINDQKQNSLLLIVDIIKEEGESASGGHSSLDIKLLARLAKGVLVTLRHCLCRPEEAGSETMPSVYDLSRCILALPAVRVDKGGMGWLVDWCKAQSMSNCVKPTLALFLHRFTALMAEVGRILIQSTADDVRKFRDSLNTIDDNNSVNSNSNNKAYSWPMEYASLQDAASKLSELDDAILKDCEASRAVRQTSNAYKRPSPETMNKQCEWMISKQSRESIEAFLLLVGEG